MRVKPSDQNPHPRGAQERPVGASAPAEIEPISTVQGGTEGHGAPRRIPARSMYPSYAVSCNHGYGRHWDHHDDDMQVRRLPDRCRKPRNHISPVVKCLLFSFNFLFWLLGVGIAVTGFWILVGKDKVVRDILDVFLDPAILMCIAGCIIFKLGFFGCLGALRENICLLKTFHVSLTIILLLELVLGVVVFIFYYLPSARPHMGLPGPEETLQQAVVRYRDDDDLRDMIDTFQREFKCCGVSNSDEGYRDWQMNMYFNCSENNNSVERCGVPHSCCKVAEGEMINVMCGFDTTNKEKPEVLDKIYSQGCLKGFGTWLERNTLIVGIVCLAVILPQILGICLARGLIEQIRLQKAQWTD